MKQDTDDYFNRDMDSWRSLPIFQQSEVILEIIENIIDGVPVEDTKACSDYVRAMYTYHSRDMMENALLIPSKIAAAHSGDVYDLKMENATLIRKAAQDILIDIQGLHQAGFIEKDYLDLLRDNIETLRPLFARWVQTFDPSEYVIDSWGLFNPPGVSYTDTDENSINPESHNADTFSKGYEDDWDDLTEEEES